MHLDKQKVRELNAKLPKHPLKKIGKQLWYIHEIEYYMVVKMNELQLHVYT